VTRAEVSDDELLEVVGAFWPPDTDLFRVLLGATAQHLGGDLAELGVLYGRSSILVGSSLQPGEVFTVVDLFEAPAADGANLAENASSYEGLTRAAFEGNYRRVHGDLPVVVQGFSETVTGHARHGSHRFVHVDASHLHQHVVADIRAARTLLKPDGVLVLDDIREEHTPGVAAAAWQAVVTDGLRPFAISPHKLYCTFGDGAEWRDAVAAWAGRAGWETETQVVNDQPLLRVSAPRRVPPPHPARRFVPPVVWPAVRRAGLRLGLGRD
jgi:SAM-dependent methyltransferase